MTPNAETIDTVARTAWGEARGCGAAGMRHVISVIQNRARKPRWWGHDLESVCFAPRQFSCRNPGDPNRARLLSVTEADTEFRIAKQLATDAVRGRLPDETGGADSYFALSMKTPPTWAALGRHTFSDGWHAFYITTEK